MSWEATNMAHELRAEKLRHTLQRHIASVTSLDGQHQETNEGTCWEFREY